MTQTIIREGEARNISWWDQYVGSLRGQYGVSSSFSSQAIDEIYRSTEEILSTENIPNFDSELWNENSGLRIGAAVGSIQSGKTANMIGVAAKGLDRGFRIVIVLGGLKNDLRSQTANRFCRDLLCKGESVIVDGISLGSNHPLGNGKHGPREDCWSPSISGDVNHQASRVRRKLRTELGRGNSVLIVAKKNVNTLDSLADALSSLCQRIPASEIPLLIIDDEYDEASVLRDPDAPTPERITRIWGDRGHKVAYIGYTATIQANIFQERDNDLWPRNFIELLRFPAARESALTFFEPDPNKRYTGPEVFFNYLEQHNERNFLTDGEMSDAEFQGISPTDKKLEQALISYFVSGAIRLLIGGKSLVEADNLTAPHTMLIHTELEIEEHWGMARRVMQLMHKKGDDNSPIPPNYRRISPEDKINSQHLETWLKSQEEEWQNAYRDFKESSEILTRIQPDRQRYVFPPWNEVKNSLNDVFLNTKLRVINSDELDADLDFNSRTNIDGSKDIPNDVYSIIVGGNKLSRGLTLEGLCVSYFCRSSAIIAEDTTVQRERWFGYRGKHLEFCRLFSNQNMIESLSRFVYHEIDLKEQFYEAKMEGVNHWDSHVFRFLRMAHSTPTHATGRGQIRSIQFSGAKPFIRRVQMGTSDLELGFAEKNLNSFSEMCKHILAEGEEITNSENRILGHCLYNQSIEVVIDLLEGLEFTFHNPNPKSPIFINLKQKLRSKDSRREESIGFNPSQDPYLIAAYLKDWKDAYQDRTRELQNNLGMKWDPLPAPKFNIAIRFGSLDPEPPFNFALMNRAISEDGELISGWGSRGYGTDHIDEWFDEPSPHDTLPQFREQGRNGLILIHIISGNSMGPKRTGETYCYARPTLALNIPKGGPSVLSIDTGD